MARKDKGEMGTFLTFQYPLGVALLMGQKGRRGGPGLSPSRAAGWGGHRASETKMGPLDSALHAQPGVGLLGQASGACAPDPCPGVSRVLGGVLYEKARASLRPL